MHGKHIKESPLKVDSNEKLGGSERSEKFSFSLVLWRSRVIFNLNMLIPVKLLFRFRLLQVN
jgi:hypothetical protein